MSKDKEKISSMTYKEVAERIDKEFDETYYDLLKGAVLGFSALTAASTYTTAMLAYSAGSAISKGISAIQNVINVSGDIPISSLPMDLYGILKK